MVSCSHSSLYHRCISSSWYMTGLLNIGLLCISIVNVQKEDGIEIINKEKD